MILHTRIPLKPQKHTIDYKSKLLLLGSCFSEHIGRKLSYFKFQTLQNPFGILFHPKAIENLIEKTVSQNKYTEDALFFYQERWHSFEAHSSLSSNSKELLLDNLNSSIKHTYTQLQGASHIIITLGTAWVYALKESHNIVANCHKVPQQQFEKQLLSVATIVNSLQHCLTLIASINTSAKIIFTVSPVRHIKDGTIENQRSKSHLITAIHQLLDSSKNNAFYFPSYELMMDELRDYRFYAEDMIHPNATAINYIWEKFRFSWINDTTQSTMHKVDSLQKGLAHRPFNSNSEAHKKFLKTLEQKKETLEKAFPFMTF